MSVIVDCGVLQNVYIMLHRTNMLSTTTTSNSQTINHGMVQKVRATEHCAYNSDECYCI